MDELDKNIIFELEKNGRITSTEISRKLGVSNLTITRRMQSMLHESKAVKVMGVPDPAQMGWHANAAVVLKCDYGKVNAVVETLKDIININHLVTLIGEYSVLAMVGASSWDKMQTLFETIRGLNGVLVMETYCIGKTPKRYVFGNDGFSFGELKQGAKPLPLDEIDNRIIRELLNDGRISFARLAEKIAEPLSVVRRRTLQLFEHETVRVKPMIDLNYMLDVRVGVFVVLNVEQEHIAENIEYLKRCDEIVIVQILVNNADILFLLQGTKPEPVYSILKTRLAHLKGVLNIKTYFRSEIKKRYYCKDLESELKSFALEGNRDLDTNGL